MAKTTDIANVASFIKSLSDLSGDYTMPSQQQLLLLGLYVNGVTNQADIEEMTGVKRSSNSRNITKLGFGERGEINAPRFLESFEDPMDRRTKLVRLTPKGKALVESAWLKAFVTPLETTI
jgi:DNA-binding MarR family transcriptional regulator